jgi:site-specific DNA-methyltransferase (adenine-specific)
LIGTVAANVLAHGTGAINVDGGRVPAVGRPLRLSKSEVSDNAFGDGLNGSKAIGSTDLGRFPANLIHDGSPDVLALFPETGKSSKRVSEDKDAQANTFSLCRTGVTPRGYEDNGGSAARFFYCAKASKADRTESGTVENKHPTVKPHDLMRYLCRLVTPPDGIVLDPFMGSGSTGKAAVAEGFGFVGIERDADSFETAQKRIEK